MPDEAPRDSSFHIGFAMAGAVSAGAYTAGVFDFLIQALSEWEVAKDDYRRGVRRPEWKGMPVTEHKVFISVISGASAGGIVGALGLVSLSEGRRLARA